MTDNRPRTGLFKKGQSGNPGGRPKVEGEIRELAQKHGPSAIRRLVKLMHSENERVAVAACQALLDRGYGKAPQALEHFGKDGAPLQSAQPALTTEQFKEAMRELKDEV